MGVADCCGTATRCILIVINVPIFLAGLVFLIAGGVFKAQAFDFYPDLEKYSSNVDSVLIPLMVIGAILLVIGLLGCVGGCTEKGWLLKPYFVVVLIIVLAQIALIIAGVVKKDKVKETTEKYAKELFDKYKERFVGNDDQVVIEANERLAVNTAQNLFGCCGLKDGPSWWKADSTKYPPGCCSKWDSEPITDDKALVSSCTDQGKLYEDGCTEKVDSLLDEFGVVIIGVIIAIIVFQVLCLAAAVYVWKKGDAANELA